MPKDRIHIHRDIADGEIFRHDGPIKLHGNVGIGAQVDIVDGGIMITGNIGDKASIRTRGNGGLLGGITISGVIGQHVTLDSDLGVRINQAGDHLRVRSGHDINFGKTGALFNASAAGSIMGGDVGPNARLRCKGSCTIASAGEGSRMEAEGLLQMTSAGHDARLSCDFFDAATLGADSIVTARDQALVGAAHISAKVFAKTVHIRETFRK